MRREPSLSVGILRFQSMVPHQICALGIQTPHTPLPYTYLGHMHRVHLSSYSTPSRGYRQQASPLCGAMWTSITLQQQAGRGCTTKLDSAWSVLQYVLVRCPPLDVC